jgi:hypothetical protein
LPFNRTDSPSGPTTVGEFKVGDLVIIWVQCLEHGEKTKFDRAFLGTISSFKTEKGVKYALVKTEKQTGFKSCIEKVPLSKLRIATEEERIQVRCGMDVKMIPKPKPNDKKERKAKTRKSLKEESYSSD